MKKFQTCWNRENAEYNYQILKRDRWPDAELWRVFISPRELKLGDQSDWQAFIIKPASVPIWECTDPHFAFLVKEEDCVEKLK